MSRAKVPRIFVVEDEAVIAIALQERLEALGYEVCGATARGETAVQSISESRPDLVLMDVKLAGSTDGVEVAQELREHSDVPIVFLTAYSDPELLARVARTNCYGYLVKPFEERELHATLQVVLARHAIERELREQVTVDALTGLRNRRFLNQVLPMEVSRARRERQPLAVVMIDIDNFKQLNDTHGHDAGDHVLQYIAFTLRGAVRASDLVCRYGGDEFTMVMPDMDARGAAQKVRSVCSVIRESGLSYRGVRLTFTVSAGVAALPLLGGTPEDLLRDADAALYRAKQEGRDWVHEAEIR